MDNIPVPTKPTCKYDEMTETFVKETISALFMETNLNKTNLHTIEKRCIDHKEAIDFCTSSMKNVQGKLEEMSNPTIGQGSSLGSSQSDKNEVNNSGLDGLCEFAMEINDKVSGIINIVLANEYEVSKLIKEMNFIKEQCNQSCQENCGSLEKCLDNMDRLGNWTMQLKKDMERCKRIMSNDFILSNSSSEEIFEDADTKTLSGISRQKSLLDVEDQQNQYGLSQKMGYWEYWGTVWIKIGIW